LPLDASALRPPLEDRLQPEGIAWLDEAIETLESEPAQIRTLFPVVGRKVGREPLDPEADPDDPHAWTVDDAARVLLLVALGADAEPELRDLYRYGDAAERRGLLRALAYLPIVDRGVGLVDDAIRTNDTRLIAAALGPYATVHLDDAAYDQAVLKCVFSELAIMPLDGLPQRATPEGARMLAALVHERIAAGRHVAAEVWTVIDRHPPEAELRAIEAELQSPFEDRRRAAERALEARPAAPEETTTR
jgi:hypothetical protein